VRETADGERRRVFTRHSGGSHLEDATLWALVARVGRWLEVLECGRPPRDAAPSLGRSTPSEELRLRVQVSWSMFRRSHRIRRRLHTACPPAAVPLRLDSRAMRAPWKCGATERRSGSWAGTGWARWKGQAGGMIGQSLSLMRCLWPVPMLLDGRCRRGDQIEIRVVVQIVINDVWIFVTASLLVHHPLAEDQCHQK